MTYFVKSEFAWYPVRLTDGETVFLEKYYLVTHIGEDFSRSLSEYVSKLSDFGRKKLKFNFGAYISKYYLKDYTLLHDLREMIPYVIRVPDKRTVSSFRAKVPIKCDMTGKWMWLSKYYQVKSSHKRISSSDESVHIDDVTNLSQNGYSAWILENASPDD